MTKEKLSKAPKSDELSVIFPDNAESSRLMLGTSIADYEASRIARAVEDTGSEELNLNATSLQADGYQLVVALRINRRDPSAAARSLERYGFDVLDMDVNEADDATMQLRYQELMHYLSM